MDGGRNVRAKEEEEEQEQGEDRISRLPDELIHEILSLNDAKFAVETSQYSTRWKHVWETLPQLNFDRRYFSRVHDFSKFVAQFLSHRNHHSDFAVLNLKCTEGVIKQSLIKKIAVYAASHNVKKINIISTNASMKSRGYKCQRVYALPLSVFSSPSLQQLCLDIRCLRVSNLPKSAWILPTLTTLVLKQISFEFCCHGHSSKSADLFSNLLILKNLTLYDCSTAGLEVFNVFSPQLENLVIGGRSQYRCKFVVSAPKLLSFHYSGDYGLLLSTNDLNSLENVYIDIDGSHGYSTLYRNYENKKQKIRQEVIDHMFHQLGVARYVSLTLGTIEVISWALDLVQTEPSPFNKMESLKIEGGRYRYGFMKPQLPIGVITYLSNSSPKSIVINEIMDYFQDS